ncbi:MAG: LysR substrate-binding domain-containing protein [Rhodospirillales bacterium]
MPQTINLRQLDAFRSVMLSGTVTQAATMLNISQPAVSRLLQHLEERAGVPLFIRRRGRLYPTPEAELLFQETERAYTGLDRIADFIDNLDSFKTGQFDILASTPMGHTILPKALAEFKQQYPDVRTTFKIMVRREFSNWFSAQNFDLAVSTFPIDYPMSVSEVFAQTKGVCVMPVGHPLAEKRVVHARDLEGQPFVSLVPETMSRFRTDQVFDAFGVRRNMIMEAQNSLSICELAVAGIGVSVVDPFTAAMFTEKQLVARPFKPFIDYDFGFMFPLNRPVARIAEHFASIVRTVANAEIEKFPKS